MVGKLKARKMLYSVSLGSKCPVENRSRTNRIRSEALGRLGRGAAAYIVEVRVPRRKSLMSTPALRWELTILPTKNTGGGARVAGAE